MKSDPLGDTTILSLLPHGAAGAEAFADGWVADMLPSEEALVARAVDKRRREFATGRDCARRALSQLGWDEVPILAGPKREPLWPAGIVGSITHCPGYCAAIVARSTSLLGGKEAVYKAWYPLAGTWLGFLDGALEQDVRRRTFVVRMAKRGSVAAAVGFEGRWAVSPDHVCTVATAVTR